MTRQPPPVATYGRPDDRTEGSDVIFVDGLGGFVAIGVWVFCFIDVLLTPESACRSLPKLAWVFVVLLIPTLGAVAWLVAGKPWGRANVAGRRPGVRPGVAGGRGVPMNPDDDEEFLAVLRARAEDGRRRSRDTDPDEPPNGTPA